MTNSSSSQARIQSIEHFISHYSVKFLHSLPSPPIHPTPHTSPPSPSASRQAASSAMESGDDTLCSPDAPPHPKLLLFSCCVCAHPHPHRLRPGARGGNGWKESFFFFSLSLILFFCLPSNLSPFPHKKKKKKTNKISERNCKINKSINHILYSFVSCKVYVAVIDIDTYIQYLT